MEIVKQKIHGHGQIAKRKCTGNELVIIIFSFVLFSLNSFSFFGWQIRPYKRINTVSASQKGDRTVLLLVDHHLIYALLFVDQMTSLIH